MREAESLKEMICATVLVSDPKQPVTRNQPLSWVYHLMVCPQWPSRGPKVTHLPKAPDGDSICSPFPEKGSLLRVSLFSALLLEQTLTGLLSQKHRSSVY